MKLKTTPEEEMIKLKMRYAQNRGVEPVVETSKEPVKKITNGKSVVKRPLIDLKPYLDIIENDFRRLAGLKSREQIKKENTYDPLMAAWLSGR